MRPMEARTRSGSVAQSNPAIPAAAGGRRQERAEDVDGRGLACAVRPEEAEDLAFVHVEGNAVNGSEGLESFGEVLNG